MFTIVCKQRAKKYKSKKKIIWAQGFYQEDWPRQADEAT